ncbi:MAG: hypothetical protein C0472_14505 [Erythrobacter sp.]|nr:hypothetical protein [Erythrobacter sp.]MBA4172370.1 hypothetical protein [Hyphomicrobium sp.]
MRPHWPKPCPLNSSFNGTIGQVWAGTLSLIIITAELDESHPLHSARTEPARNISQHRHTLARQNPACCIACSRLEAANIIEIRKDDFAHVDITK